MEYGLLEEQLQKTLSDLEKREKALAHAETEVRRRWRVSLSVTRVMTDCDCAPLDPAAAAGDARRARVQHAGAAGQRPAPARGLRPPGGAGEVEGQAARGSTGPTATAGKHSKHDLCPSESVSWEGSGDPGVMRSRPQLMSILSNPPVLK